MSMVRTNGFTRSLTKPLPKPITDPKADVPKGALRYQGAVMMYEGQVLTYNP